MRIIVVCLLAARQVSIPNVFNVQPNHLNLTASWQCTTSSAVDDTERYDTEHWQLFCSYYGGCNLKDAYDNGHIVTFQLLCCEECHYKPLLRSYVPRQTASPWLCPHSLAQMGSVHTLCLCQSSGGDDSHLWNQMVKSSFFWVSAHAAVTDIIC